MYLRFESGAVTDMNDSAKGAGLENEVIFDLVDSYKNKYRGLHEKNTAEYFDHLVRKSGISVRQNQKTNKKIKETESHIRELADRINKGNTRKKLLVGIIIVSAILILVQVMAMAEVGMGLVPLLIIGLGAASIAMCVYLMVKFSQRTRKLKTVKYDLESVVRGLKAEAREQLRPLNELFTPKVCPLLFSKTLPNINLDKIFDTKRLDYLVGKFGFEASRDNNRSTIYVQSGDINGNPFFICCDRTHELGTKTYTGSRTIHWITTHSTGGKTSVRHHSQTLTASVEKPCPYYKKQAYLVYGNEAAPDLVFSRQDSDAEHMAQKEIDKQVSKKIKKLNKRAERNTARGDSFTVLGNSEFEVLFGAVDRNNEVQFRLLFTPLAQKQLLELMKEKEAGFGDDFGFVKRKMINYLYPKHLEDIKLSVTSEYFQGYDIDAVKSKFISYNNEYFRHVYFALAPILAIPLYQQQKPREYIYRDLYDSYASFYEDEYIANSIFHRAPLNPRSTTPSILKTTVLASGDNCDTIRVTAYGYCTEQRIDYVQKLGGDGRLHRIPVEWTEYIPVTQDTDLVVNIISDESDRTTYYSKFKEVVERLRTQQQIDEKDIFRVGMSLAYILKK